MSSIEIAAAASDPAFYTRVSFIALKVAQNVASEDPSAPNHENRVAYSNRVFRGDDNAILLAQHVVASNPTISAACEDGKADDVPDGDIEFALASIWDARANAFGTPAPMILAAGPQSAPEAKVEAKPAPERKRRKV